MGAPMILLHAGPVSDVSGWQILRLWSLDWLAVIPLGLGILYAVGLRRWPVRTKALRPWQPYAFYAGIASLLIALVSPVGALDDSLFFVHMIQHLLLVLFAPPLILLGAPTTPLLRALPRAFRQGVITPLMRNRQVRAGYRAITFPPVTWLLFVGDLVAWHFNASAFDASVRNSAIHDLEHASFLVVAMLFWLVIVDPRPMRSRLSYPLRVVFIGASILANVLMGAAITFHDGLLYASYASSAQALGISASTDQATGGLIMWIIGDIPIVAALLITIFRWMETEQEKSLLEEMRTDLAQQAETMHLTPDTHK